MISYLICTHNEGECVNSLLSQLSTSFDKGDEIVVVDDESTDSLTIEYLLYWKNKLPNMTVYSHKLNNHFADHKNFGRDRCTSQWIFQLDADELMSESLLKNIHTLLEYNDEIELINVPRINVVDGLTKEDIQKWNWSVNENGWVMWPDFQTRIFQNIPRIRWQGRVHERIVGFKTMSNLPIEPEWAIQHHKTISRQREQNKFYERISG